MSDELCFSWKKYCSSLITHHSYLFHPTRDKHVRIPRTAVIPVGRPGNFFAVGREHGKRIEDTFRGDLFQARAIFVDHVQLEIGVAGRVVVAGKDDFFA